ncbi:heterokaryon incompatibility protein-domain-containing protein [Ilyonectria robusta]|uniref:heterokaryon incompatibility protein-domain-containing protein n=1 Tax=Ilyonectria robusta TaxID=1079257 RepID=UPI001E8CE007|nr:heterokaryon incompatibility protein-domain-containing protein [Ilyonectria robusta]KAH8653298.1 heterokaryon incompatibility protein-domain-containing protein [Ilyonectria robusta]
MWLLDAKSVRLDRIDDENQVPPYAILSHTWANDEISFQEMRAADTVTDLTTKAGWLKIENACRLTLEYGLSYVWIDTCCIDKSSSAELQEAINSMFKWYEYAAICFAHLADVSANEDHTDEGSAFHRCRWFKRGWTLQELLAPTEIVFYDKCWKPISPKALLQDIIGSVTGIKTLYLRPTNGSGGAYERLSSASIAERMSWVAERETTRPEDLAYCLLGIFDINMPMLYGEGIKAFQRLQEEIMRVNDDSSILSWGYQELCSDWRLDPASILAPHPSFFRNCRDIRPCALKGFNSASFTMNQRGLQMKVPVRADLTHKQLVYIILGCAPRSEREWSIQEDDSQSFVAIPLVSTSACDQLRMHGVPQKGEYLRPNWCRPALVSEEFLEQAEPKELVIRRPSEQHQKFRELPLALACPPIPNNGYTIIGTYPPQPIGGQFTSILQYPSHQIAPWARNIQRSFEVEQKTGTTNIKPFLVHSEEDQRMIHIRIPSLGAFLVVFDYKAVVSTIGPIPIWQRPIIDCRVFHFPEPFRLEALHRLVITQDFTHLKELDHQCKGERYIFGFGNHTEIYLEIELSNMENASQITDIYIRVVLSRNRRYIELLDMPEDTLLSWIDRRRRRAQVNRQTSQKIHESVQRTLRGIFPRYMGPSNR